MCQYFENMAVSVWVCVCCYVLVSSIPLICHIILLDTGCDTKGVHSTPCVREAICVLRPVVPQIYCS